VKNFFYVYKNGSRDVTIPLSGTVCRP